jgi:hypothetical protein
MYEQRFENAMRLASWCHAVDRKPLSQMLGSQVNSSSPNGL